MEVCLKTIIALYLAVRKLRLAANNLIPVVNKGQAPHYAHIYFLS